MLETALTQLCHAFFIVCRERISVKKTFPFGWSGPGPGLGSGVRAWKAALGTPRPSKMLKSSQIATMQAKSCMEESAEMSKSKRCITCRATPSPQDASQAR